MGSSPYGPNAPRYKNHTKETSGSFNITTNTKIGTQPAHIIIATGLSQ
jgi:hypothetical protein